MLPAIKLKLPSTASAVFVCLFVLVASRPAFGGSITNGVYDLSSHLDGGVRPPVYGLRLDGLLDGNSNTEVTFDFNDISSNMLMAVNYSTTLSDSTIRIFGDSWGGEDDAVNGVYITPEVYHIDVTYTHVKKKTDAKGRDVLFTDNAEGMHVFIGTIANEDRSKIWNLTPQSNGSYSFELSFNHRLPDGVSDPDVLTGHGWVNHTPAVFISGENTENTTSTHLYASDWLFLADPPQGGGLVPSPAAFGVGVFALSGLVLRRRR